MKFDVCKFFHANSHEHRDSTELFMVHGSSTTEWNYREQYRGLDKSVRLRDLPQLKSRGWTLTRNDTLSCNTEGGAFVHRCFLEHPPYSPRPWGSRARFESSSQDLEN